MFNIVIAFSVCAAPKVFLAWGMSAPVSVSPRPRLIPRRTGTEVGAGRRRSRHVVEQRRVGCTIIMKCLWILWISETVPGGHGRTFFMWSDVEYWKCYVFIYQPTSYKVDYTTCITHRYASRMHTCTCIHTHTHTHTQFFYTHAHTQHARTHIHTSSHLTDRQRQSTLLIW